MVCRQCPDYKADIGELLFPPVASYWLPPLPASALLPSPPKAAATEGGAKAAGEQPSTSSDVPSGDGELHHPRFSLGHTVGIQKIAFYSNFSTFAAPCAAPQEYRCPPRGFHVFCTCCLQPMPDRRAELGSQQVAQQCEWWPKPPTEANFRKRKSFFAAVSFSWFSCFLIEAVCLVSAPFQTQRCLRVQFYYSCAERVLCKQRYTPEVQDVLCSGRWAVPALLLSHVLGLPEDWLSRLPGSIQR